jgi:hypothetical protein
MENFANTNEPTFDGDNSFNQSSTPNQIDTFIFDNVPTGTISAVQHVLMARQDGGAQRQIAPLQRRAGTDTPGATFNPAGTYAALLNPQDVDPATSSAWTVDNFNATEFGYKLIS